MAFSKRRRLMHFCMICQREFVSVDYLISHLLNDHLNLSLFKCCQPNCGADFATENLFNLHCKFKHAGKRQSIVDERISSDQANRIRYILHNCAIYENIPLELPTFLIALLLLEKRKNILNAPKCDSLYSEQAKFFHRSIKSEPPTDDADLYWQRNFSKSDETCDDFLCGFRKIPCEVFTIESGLKMIKTEPNTDTTAENGNFSNANGMQRNVAKDSIVKCQLCKKYYRNHNRGKFIHSIFHLNKESESKKVNWLFKCLQCSTTFMYSTGVRRHLIRCHRIEPNSIQRDVHYKDRTSLYYDKITKIRNVAFPENISIETKQSNADQNTEIETKASENATHSIQATKNQIQCNLCRKFFSNTSSSQRYHSILHLKMESNVNWLFKCLLCNETSMYKEDLCSHLSHLHNVNSDSLKLGVHYDEQLSIFEKEIDGIQRKAFPDKSLVNAKFSNYCKVEHKNGEKKRSKNASVSHRGAVAQSSAMFANRILCQLCKISIPYASVSLHVHKHLADQSGITWLYECVLCKEYRHIQRQCVCGHLAKKHKINIRFFKEEQRYIHCRKSMFSKEISRIHSLAFPNVGVVNRKKGFVGSKRFRAFCVSSSKRSLKKELHESADDELCCKKDNIDAFFENGTPFTANSSKTSNSFVVKKQYNEVDRIECRLCEAQIRRSKQTMLFHTISHLKTESNVTYLFKCLVCDDFKSMYEGDVRKHLVKKHHKSYGSMINYAYYENRLSICKKEIDRVQLLAFPDIKARSSKVLKSGAIGTVVKSCQAKTRECKLCNKRIARIASHCIFHLPEIHSHIEWLYKCLICSDFQTLYYTGITQHIIGVHDTKRADVKSENYISRKSNFTKEIAHVRSLAFPREKV